MCIRDRYKMAALNIHAFIDDVIVLLMQKLGLEIPKFVLKRYFGVSKHEIKDAKGKKTDDMLLFRGLDSNGDPYTLFPKIELKSKGKSVLLDKEPFALKSGKGIELNEPNVDVTLHFQGHYGEGPLKIGVNLSTLQLQQEVVYGMDFDPALGTWTVNMIGDNRAQ
eukprot:TRINITY_DN182_c0_g2_i1.p2 TRINITY_DN182_c0_g2~~TRINITY_DN182_c0_g2_i1.p2  ORF type:complete len:165 (-),score=23.65 TRINITY_DN182_c0_g2_i1:60-554(-)